MKEDVIYVNDLDSDKKNYNIREVDDIEIEDIDESGELDSDSLGKIKIRTKQSIMGELIDRLKHDAINLFPDFQRKDDLWNERKQSQLIESILLQMPIPSFYFDGSDDDKWQVVDGLQRLSTIRNFVIKKTLTLKGLEFLKQYEGYSFDELPYSMKRRISVFPITLYIIEEGTSEAVKFILFKRINTGGLTLSAQEIRHALNQGVPTKFISKLANLEVFKKATDYKIRTKRLEDKDFVTRFIAFFVLGFENYDKSDLDSFMNKGMQSLHNKPKNELNYIEHKFIQAMQLAYDIFEDDAFRKRLNNEHSKYPINKALFETLSVNFAQLNEEEAKTILQKKDLFKTNLMELMNNTDFHKAISVATGQKSRVTTRFEKIKDIILKIIND